MKFGLPMFNEEIDAKKLDNWIIKNEVYYRIQKLASNEAKI